MHATFQCTCGKHLDAEAQKPGDRAQCPACGNVFVIGQPVKTTTAIQDEAPKSMAAQITTTPHVNVLSGVRATEVRRERTWHKTLRFFGIVLGIPIALVSIVGFFCIRPMGGGSQLMDVSAAQVKGTLTNACKTFKHKNGHWPATLDELLLKNEKGGPYVENPDALIDPWGNRYQYDAKGPMNNGAKPDIWAVVPHTGVKLGNWPRIPLKE